MDKEQRIGTTEIGEIAFNLDAFDRLYKGNIIITKRLTDKLIEKLIEHKDKCILHVTCTGMGGTKIEPLVPMAEATRDKVVELLSKGFPVEQVVLRIDPIVPTEKGIATAVSVVKLFSGLGIKRVRMSFLDMYKHVRERFKENGIPIPDNYGINNFHANEMSRLSAWTELTNICNGFGMEIEMCGEPPIFGTKFESTPCVSQKDIDILGLTDEIKLEGNKEARTHCGCPANKSELLKTTPKRCGNGCLYCFWKD